MERRFQALLAHDTAARYNVLYYHNVDEGEYVKGGSREELLYRWRIRRHPDWKDVQFEIVYTLERDGVLADIGRIYTIIFHSPRIPTLYLTGADDPHLIRHLSRVLLPFIAATIFQDAKTFWDTVLKRKPTLFGTMILHFNYHASLAEHRKFVAENFPRYVVKDRDSIVLGVDVDDVVIRIKMA